MAVKYKKNGTWYDISSSSNNAVDAVENGNLNPVTSNAVYDALNTVTSKELKYSSFVNPSNYINNTYSAIRVIKKSTLTIVNVFILVDLGVPINTEIKITDNIKGLLEVDTFYNTEICIAGIISNDNVSLTDRKALLMLNPNSDSLSLKLSSTDGGWIKTQIII